MDYILDERIEEWVRGKRMRKSRVLYARRQRMKRFYFYAERKGKNYGFVQDAFLC